ncbi:MAG TPA: NAD-dependent epimerase/dehydratase family protein [Candidatus Koribacter sp.]|jgi:dTDP-L-rhamnose 4-epimerase
MRKRVLVTGGAGFVGSHLVDALLENGHEVRVFDSLSPQVHPNGLPGYLARDIEFVQGDMRDLEAVRRVLTDIDVIFHKAAAVGVGQSMYEISNYMGANTQGTANLLQAMLDSRRGFEKLIIASSMSIYGEGKYKCAEHGEMAPPPRSLLQLRQKRWEAQCPICNTELLPVATDEAKPLQCTSIYALSKKDQEEMCLLFGHTYAIPVVALRYFNIYGTRQALSNPYTGVAAIFAARLLNKRSPMVFEDGCQQRDFVSVHDIVQANLKALERADADGQAINIGSGSPISISQVAESLAKSLGVRVEPEVTGKYRAGDIRHCFADIGLARKVLGYEPQFQFAHGIGELVEWLRSQSATDKVSDATQQLTAYGLTA